ncbi:MAG: hypothetical protein ABIN80_28270 [Dyadobacter sp.]|uniref:hypothetical protein n=1 Tax=Dyadobacter sp. TaxID=1914288 RepID=UPI0032643479
MSIPVNTNGDTSFWNKYQSEKFAEIGLSNLAQSRDSLILRISTEIQSIEIRTTNFETFSGKIYNFTKKVSLNPDQQSKEVQNKWLSNKTAIKPTTARQVYELSKKLSIDTIPSEEQIKRWPIGADGMSYIIEYATPSTYSFKSYWEPSTSRYTLKEAAAIDNFTKELKATLELYTCFDTFINSLPAGTYHAGGILAITTTKKRLWKRR